MIRARLRGAGPEREACLVDVSSRGLSASVDNPPRRGDYVELVVGDIVLVGQVKWSGTRRFGMTFRERISVVGLVAGDSRTISLKSSSAVRQRENRGRLAPDGSQLAKRIEFVILIAAGAAATFVVADFAGAALHPLDDAKIALAAREAG